MKVEHLVVAPERDNVTADAERRVIRDFESALRHVTRRAYEVGPRDELPAFGRHQDPREGRVGFTVVAQPLVAQDQLVRPAVADEAIPDDSRRVCGGPLLLGDGGKGVVAVLAAGAEAGSQAGVQEALTIPVGIVVRHF